MAISRSLVFGIISVIFLVFSLARRGVKRGQAVRVGSPDYQSGNGGGFDSRTVYKATAHRVFQCKPAA